jgi:hypothetical protein
MQAAIGVDQQIGKLGTISLNYLPSRGDHQFLTRVSQDSITKQLNYTYESSGVYRENQLFVNANIRTRVVTGFGYYALNVGNSNTSGSAFIPTSTNPRVDYGRAGFVNRNFAVIGAGYTAPYKISLAPFMIVHSGTPYNITTGLDNNGDAVYNDRPAFTNGTSASCSTASSFTSPTPGTAYTEIPINYCTGPAAFTFNLRASRSFGDAEDAAAAVGEVVAAGVVVVVEPRAWAVPVDPAEVVALLLRVVVTT